MLGAVLVIILCCFTATNGTCWYYSSSNSIRCTGMSQSCAAATPTLGTGLALPKGEYLIGPATTWHAVRWFNLYPKRASGGYWDYHSRSPDHNCRGGFGLHEGTVSAGCVTVLDSSCFDKIIASIERSSRKTYNMNECGRFGCPFNSCSGSVWRNYYTKLYAY